MNILFLSTDIPYPPYSGHYQRTYNILKLLSRENNLHFLGFSQDQNGFEKALHLKRIAKSVNIFRVPRTGYNFLFLKNFIWSFLGHIPGHIHRYLSKEAICTIRKILNENKIDLVHVDILHLGQYIDYIKLFSDVPIVVNDHNVEYLRLYRLARIEKNVVLKLIFLWQSILLKQFERRVLLKADYCVAVSKQDMEILNNLCGGKKIFVVPNGVDTDYFRPFPITMDSNLLVWVGRIDAFHNSKAVSFFLKHVWPKLKKQRHDLKFLIIGKGSIRVLDKAIRQDDSIEYKGFVEDIRPFVQKASMFVAPLLSGGGTKLKVLNAMAQAKAVVGTPIAFEGIEAVNGTHGIIVDDLEIFADKILYFLEKPSETEEIGRNALMLIKSKYSWEVIGSYLNALYRSFAMK